MRFRPYFTALFILLLIGSLRSEAPNSELKKIEDDYWQHLLDNSVNLQMKYGMAVQKLPDVTYRKEKSEAAFAQSILARLKTVDIKALDHEDFLSYQILEWQNQKQIEGLNYFFYSSPVTPYASQISVVNRIFTEHHFTERKDLEHYAKLLHLYPG